MDVQLVAVLVMLVAAAGYVGRAVWRTWSAPAGGCGAGCGKCAAPSVEVKPGRISLV